MEPGFQVFACIKEGVSMGNVLLLEQNIEGRKERAPLGAASYLFNLTGIIGNILVLHVFRFVFAAAAIVIIITIVLQIRIRTALVKKARSKQKMRYGVSSISSKSGQETSGSETPKKRSNRAKKSADDQDSERNRRVAIRFAIISMFLIVSFISQTVFQFIIVTKRYFFPRQRISKLEDVVEEYFPDIVALNGILNPFVYLFTDNEFRQELKKMCWRRI
ncbi:uncharacterized protein LOC130050682 [Ostrea edulis]|uniref:uncharacterized protein LOC130050682 n=1 Tax=Ostrea edulis TaxID=37623 RepID=UPI0024AFA118|nr:uncharacterized protein LOC130050682 [Ostrea edulis]